MGPKLIQTTLEIMRGRTCFCAEWPAWPQGQPLVKPACGPQPHGGPKSISQPNRKPDSTFRGYRKTDFIFRQNAKNGSDSHEKRNRNALFMRFLTSHTSRMRKTDFIFRQNRKTDFIFRQNAKNGSHFPPKCEKRIRFDEKRKAVAIPCKSPWLRPMEWSHVLARTSHMEQPATTQGQPCLLGWPLKPFPKLEGHFGKLMKQLAVE